MKIAIAAAAALSVISAAHATKTVTLATLTGHCTTFVGMNVTVDPTWCSPKLANFDLPNGRTGFTFVTNKPGTQQSMIISFFGVGSKQTHTDPDHVNQPIDRVDFAFNGSIDHLNATGSCAFNNAYKGVATVACRAKTSEGVFAATFISNGVSPDIDEMPAS